MADREFLLDLDVGARMRCSHRTERGQVIAFAIKTPLAMDFRSARTFAQDDILANWRRYRDLFLER